MVSVFVLLFLGWIVHPYFNHVQSPSGVVAISQCFGQVIIFLLQLLIVGAYGFLLYGKEFQQHYILKILGDDCPTEDTWSMWVGFLYTVVSSLPSSLGVIRMSRKGNDPSGPGSSDVN